MVRTPAVALLVLSACAAEVGHGGRGQEALSPALGAFGVPPTDVAVAGISSGGFMAVQLHVAYSATFQRGAAVFAVKFGWIVAGSATAGVAAAIASARLGRVAGLGR